MQEKIKELVFAGKDNKIVTTSLKVAEVFGKEHARVMRDVRELKCSEAFRLGNFAESSYMNEQNKEQPMFVMTRNGFTLLAMGYTGEKAMQFKEAYINAFDAMEAELKHQQENKMPAIPQTFAQALRLAAEQAELIEAQEKELTVARPKADYFDGLVERNLLTNFRDTAHQLGLKQKEFIEHLLKNGFVYRDKKNKLKPYQEYMPKLFKINDWQNGDKSGSQTLITPEGKETFRLLFKK